MLPRTNDPSLRNTVNADRKLWRYVFRPAKRYVFRSAITELENQPL
jgi:hypothetical protein